MRKINEKLILQRFKSAAKCSNNKETAEKLGISPQNFSHRKGRKTLLGLITKWGIENGIDLNWLLTGGTTTHNATNNDHPSDIVNPNGSAGEIIHIKDKTALIKEHVKLHIDGYLTDNEFTQIKKEILKS